MRSEPSCKTEIHISGAGPAGLAAALTVAKSGGRAIVYERKNVVGSRFHGDFQGLENWTTRGDVLEELAAAGIEPTFTHAPFREGTFFDPEGREYTYRSPEPLFYLIRRGSAPGMLDASLKSQALDAGVEIRFGEHRHHLPEGGVVAQGPRGTDVIAVGYVFETDVADGAYGVLADRLAPKGYSYLLISKGQGTIASCMFDDYHREKVYLERTVDFFHEKTGFRMKNPRRFGGVGNFVFPRRARKRGMLFAGEAAGFQDALWGFGLRYAMVSAHLAARALLEARPEKYDRLWRQRLGGLERASIVNRFFFERLGDPGYKSFLGRLDRSDDARQWLHNHYYPAFWRNLMFPVAQRLVRSSRREADCKKESCDCTFCRCRKEFETGQGSP